MMRPTLALLLALPLAAQTDGRLKGAQTNPLYQGNKSEGVNPLFQEAQRHVQGILSGLKPPVAARLQAAAEELNRTQNLNGPEAQAWQAAEVATRKALGAGMPGDTEGATAVVICLWASKKGYDYYKASSALARASQVLKTKHDTVKNAIGNVR